MGFLRNVRARPRPRAHACSRLSSRHGSSRARPDDAAAQMRLRPTRSRRRRNLRHAAADARPPVIAARDGHDEGVLLGPDAPVCPSSSLFAAEHGIVHLDATVELAAASRSNIRHQLVAHQCPVSGRTRWRASSNVGPSSRLREQIHALEPFDVRQQRARKIVPDLSEVCFRQSGTDIARARRQRGRTAASRHTTRRAAPFENGGCAFLLAAVARVRSQRSGPSQLDCIAPSRLAPQISKFTNQLRPPWTRLGIRNVSGFDLCLPSRSLNVLPWCNIDPGRRDPP